VLLAMALTSIGRLVLTSRQSLEAALARSRAHEQASSLLGAMQALPPGHPWLLEGVVIDSGGRKEMRLQGTIRPWPGMSRLQLVEVDASWNRSGGSRGNYHLEGLRRAGGQP
jgi:hypothetical protein